MTSASDASASPSGPLAPSRSLRAGLRDIIPILVGMVPFAAVTGLAVADAGYRLIEALGLSVIVFAGASQLAAVELLAGGAPAWVAVLTVLVINLRMAMYSASLASFMTREPLGRRVLASYLLTDQAYALSVARFRSTARPAVQRWWYYIGAAAALWITWQSGTVIGFVVGGVVPDTIPLSFAVPMAFLALLAPAVSDRPTLGAAIVAGAVAVAGAELPANLGMPLAAASGVVVGTVLARVTSS